MIEMDLDISNITKNSTFSAEDYYSIFFPPLEILNAITSVLSAVANVIIIYVIAKFSILRTRANMYLVNWCICNFVVMLLVPASLNLFGLVNSVSYELMCIWEEILYGILFGNLMFVVILLLDWYIMTYSRQNCSIRCRQSSKFIIALVWIIVIGLSIASLTLCVQNYSYPLTLVSFIIGYLVIFIVISLVYVLRCIKIRTSSVIVEKSNIELIIVSSYFLCWLPNWVALYGQIFLGFYISYINEYFTFFVGYSNSWIMLILLYYFNKPFNKCFRKMCRLKVEENDEPVYNKETHNTMLL